MCPLAAASINGVSFSLLLESTGAPYLIKACTISSWPVSAAMCSADEWQSSISLSSKLTWRLSTISIANLLSRITIAFHKSSITNFLFFTFLKLAVRKMLDI